MKTAQILRKLSSITLCGLAFFSLQSFVYAQQATPNQQKQAPASIKKQKKEKFSPENFQRYQKQNATVKTAPVAVFMGDSITDNWARRDKDFFEKNNYIGRGISGQVTFQMLARFRPDVIELKPKVVLILAGTNDIAQNQGIISTDNICKNIISMCELAMFNNITPVICSVLPAHRYGWRKHIDPVEKIAELNEKLKAYAQRSGIVYLDYYSALVDSRKGLSPEDAKDGVHPSNECYKNKLDPMAKACIDKILKK